MSWYDVYLNEIKLKKTAKNYIEDKIKHKQIFIKMLRKYGDKGTGKLIEAGCGTGIISSYMASFGYDVVGVDIDKNILELSNNLAQEYFGKKGKIEFVKKSIFNLDYEYKEFDVCFSNGVLEHFQDNDIVNTLKQQLYISKYVIVGIPTQFFNQNEALYGDERFLPLNHWRKLIEKSGGKIIEEHSFHYMSLFEKIMAFNKFGRPEPFRLFVIEN